MIDLEELARETAEHCKWAGTAQWPHIILAALRQVAKPPLKDEMDDLYFRVETAEKTVNALRAELRDKAK